MVLKSDDVSVNINDIQNILSKLCRGALVFLVAVIFLCMGIRTLQVEGAPTGLGSLFRLGLGNVNFNTLVNFLPHTPVGTTQFP